MKHLVPVLVPFALAAIMSVVFVGAFEVGAANADPPHLVDAGLRDAGALGDAGTLTFDAGPGSASSPLPSDLLDDPVERPSAAFDDLKAAQKLGWGVLVLAVLVMTARLLGRLGGSFAFLARGRVALAIASVGTFAMTAYNAVLLGGTWFAALAAAVVAGAAAWDAKAPSKTETAKTA